MSRSEAPLVLELRASRGFQIGLLLAAMVAMASVALADLPVSVAAVLGVAAVLVATRAWRAQAALEGQQIRISADGDVDWRHASGAEGRGRLVHHAQLGPLVALDVREQSRGVRRWAIWCDMLDADAWRRLKVALARQGGADSYKDAA